MNFKRKTRLYSKRFKNPKTLTLFNFTVFVVFLLRRHDILVSVSITKQLYS